MKAKGKLVASLKIWVVIYPSITLFLWLFGTALAGMPLYLRTLILCTVLVPWMMFVGIPLLEFVMKQVIRGDRNTLPR